MKEDGPSFAGAKLGCMASCRRAASAALVENVTRLLAAAA